MDDDMFLWKCFKCGQHTLSDKNHTAECHFCGNAVESPSKIDISQPPPFVPELTNLEEISKLNTVNLKINELKQSIYEDGDLKVSPSKAIEMIKKYTNKKSKVIVMIVEE